MNSIWTCGNMTFSSKTCSWILWSKEEEEKLALNCFSYEITDRLCHQLDWFFSVLLNHLACGLVKAGESWCQSQNSAPLCCLLRLRCNTFRLNCKSERETMLKGVPTISATKAQDPDLSRMPSSSSICASSKNSRSAASNPLRRASLGFWGKFGSPITYFRKITLLITKTFILQIHANGLWDNPHIDSLHAHQTPRKTNNSASSLLYNCLDELYSTEPTLYPHYNLLLVLDS